MSGILATVWGSDGALHNPVWVDVWLFATVNLVAFIGWCMFIEGLFERKHRHLLWLGLAIILPLDAVLFGGVAPFGCLSHLGCTP